MIATCAALLRVIIIVGSEVAMFLEPLCLSTKDIVILAVNSNSSKTAAGGSHW